MLPKKIVIIGGGPIGIEAALYGRALGHEVVLFERGVIGANLLGWGFLPMVSSWRMNTTPLGLKVVSKSGSWTGPLAERCPTGKDFRERYIAPLAGSTPLRGVIRERTAVIAVGCDEVPMQELLPERRAAVPFRLLNRSDTGREGVELADVVLDCSGTYGRHRWAGLAGIPAPGERDKARTIWYTIPDVLGRDRGRFIDRNVLLVGGGYWASVVLLNFQILQRMHPRTRVSWLTCPSGDGLDPVADDPFTPRRKIVEQALRLATRPPQWLTYIGRGAVETIPTENPFRVNVKVGGVDAPIQPDEIIVLTGAMPDVSMYEQMEIPMSFTIRGPRYVPEAPEESAHILPDVPATLATGTIVNPLPNLYFLGAKSFGLNTNFLLQVGFHQIRDVYQLIDGPPLRDLYAGYDRTDDF